MKKTSLILSGFLLVIGMAVNAEDVTTAEGQVLKNVKVVGEKPEGVKLMHDGGIAIVPNSALPAEFLAAHKLSASPGAPSASEAVALNGILEKFVASTPTLKTIDGREFKTSQIKSADPTGLKIFADSGLVKLKFTEVSKEIQDLFHYSAESAAAYERTQEEKTKNAADLGQRMANAASVVDKRPPYARLSFVQNMGVGWLCHMQFLHQVDKDVTTVRKGSSLDTPTVPGKVRTYNSFGGISGEKNGQSSAPLIYETKRTEAIEMLSDEGEVMVFGLPDYGRIKPDPQGKWQWSGRIYYLGLFEKNELQPDGLAHKVVLKAYHLDRAKAIKMIATNGVEQRYQPDGEPVADSGAKIRQALESNDYLEALSLLNAAMAKGREEPELYAQFSAKIVPFVTAKSSTLLRGGEGWEEAAAFVGKFLDSRYAEIMRDEREALQDLQDKINGRGDKLLYDAVVKSKTIEAVEQYYSHAPIRSMQGPVVTYRAWLQEHEAPRRLYFRLVKIDWRESMNKGVTGSTVIKLFVDDLEDEHNQDVIKDARTGTTADSSGIRAIKLEGTPQNKKMRVTVQVFHVGITGAWNLLSKFSKEITPEELIRKGGVKDDAGDTLTFEVDGVEREPFLPTAWRPSL